MHILLQSALSARQMTNFDDPVNHLVEWIGGRHWPSYVIRVSRRILTGLLLFFLFLFISSCSSYLEPSADSKPILVGFVAPFTGMMGSSSEATRQGMILAINEINEDGGVLGRPLALELRNVTTDLQAGERAVEELVDLGVVSVFGGIYDDVIVEYLDELWDARVPLINVWGNLPAIIKNDYDPNITFCIAAAPKQITEYLSRYPVDVLHARRPALIVEVSKWGNTYADLLSIRLAELNISTLRIERFRVGVTNMQAQIEALREYDADTVILIANSYEAAIATRTIRAIGWNVPIFTHPNIQPHFFSKQAGPVASEGVYVMHTKAFMLENNERQRHLIDSYYSTFQISTTQGVPNPAAVARGYDGIYLLTIALTGVGEMDKDALLYALENSIDYYEGILKEYRFPFSHQTRNPFDVSDYTMARFHKGKLVPAEGSILH